MAFKETTKEDIKLTILLICWGVPNIIWVFWNEFGQWWGFVFNGALVLLFVIGYGFSKAKKPRP